MNEVWLRAHVVNPYDDWYRFNLSSSETIVAHTANITFYLEQPYNTTLNYKI
jgi:hypothetical protein